MNDANFHSKRSINRKRLAAIFDLKKIKVFEVKLEVLYKQNYKMTPILKTILTPIFAFASHQVLSFTVVLNK